MTFFQAIVQTLPAPIIRMAATITRAFAAAAVNRLTLDQTSSTSSLEMDLISSNWLIRERARQLSKDNDYAQRFILEFRANVVGSNGFTLQSDVRELVRTKLDGGGEKFEW